MESYFLATREYAGNASYLSTLLITRLRFLRIATIPEPQADTQAPPPHTQLDAMRNSVVPPPRRPSLNNGKELRLAIDTSACMHHTGAVEASAGDDAVMKPPESPTRSMPSEAPFTESGSESCHEVNGKDNKRRRGSATMRAFLQRVMRSQSESHIRVVPVAALPPRIPPSAASDDWKLGRETMALAPASDERDARITESEAADDDEDAVDEDQCDTSRTLTDSELSAVSRRSDTGLGDVFLNSSLQLLQVQSDAKQRVRQLWTVAQRLRWENQLSDAGLDLLHQELLGVMKALTVEKLEGARHLKAGYLTLIQAPPAVVTASMMQRGAAAATKSLLFGNPKAALDQRMWVTISEEQCRMELVPIKTDPPSQAPAASSSPAPNTTQSDQSTTHQGAVGFPAIGKFKQSISWLLSEPTLPHKGDDSDSSPWIGRTSIRLQGCHVRRVPSAGSADASRLRVQLLVPDTSTNDAQPSFGMYVFDVLESEGEAERDEWLRAIDRVCVSHLYTLETKLRDATYLLQFRDILAHEFPVCVPLTWLRNRLERMPSSLSPQQQATFQYQQLQRRSSRNLSMVQIVKDLERDRILVDHKLLISCHRQPHLDSSTSTAAVTTLSDGTTVVEHDSVAEIMKYLVSKAMAFAKRTTWHSKHGSPSGSDATSPSSRLNRFTESRAIAFVERVLRGGSRTQSGGDIYDAISFFCQQRNLSVCPMSHDAHPVQLNVVDDEADDGEFHIEIHVSMQFKVVEMAPASDAMLNATTPREWAVLEGKLTREFTLGKLSEPGSVTVTYLPDATSSLEDLHIDHHGHNTPSQ